MKYLLLFFMMASSLFSQNSLEKVSLQLDWKYQFEFAGFIAAKEKGFYREAGLDVEFREYRNGIDVVNEVLQRKATYGVYNSNLSIEKGKIKPIVLMATYMQQSPLIFVARKGIKKPIDLIGKTIMVTDSERKNSAISLLMSHFGITVENTRFVEHTFRVDDFINGKVDAMSAFRSNQLYELDRAGVEYTIIDPVEYGFVVSSGNLFTSQREAIEHSDRAQRMVDATNRGWEYAIKNPKEMITLLKTHYGVQKSEEALHYEAQVIHQLMLGDLYRIGEADTELTTRLFKQLIRAGIIDPTQKLGKFLLRDVAENVSKKLNLTADEQGYLLHKKKILMCVDPEWYPFEAIRDGKHIGIAADVMHRFESELKISIELVPTRSWDETLQFARERKCDIFSLASSTPSRLVYMDFTSPYVTLPIMMATKMDQPFIDDIGTLTGKKLGAVKGYSITEQLKMAYPNLTIIEVGSIKEGLSMVERGELYGYIDNLMVISSYIQKEHTGQLKVSMRLEDSKVQLGVGTRNDEPLLNSIFEKLVMNTDEADMQDIYNRWVSTVEEVPWIDNEMMMKIGILFGLIIAAFLWRHYIINRYNRKLLKLSVTDKLTGLYNRQKTDQRLMEEEKKVSRYRNHHCAIMMIDVDYFKKINDTMGHQIGDEILIEIATLMKNNFRQSDIIGRWGGEEFMVILPHTTSDEAKEVAESFRKKVETHHYRGDLNVTVSIGVGELSHNESIHECVAQIDQALYEAKAGGRNRVCSVLKVEP